jgi:hypothetical protein
VAKHLNSSRSELYTRALGEFLRRHAPDRVTHCAPNCNKDLLSFDIT